VALSGLALCLYGMGYIRYIVILLEAVLVLCFRKKLFSFLKSMK